MQSVSFEVSRPIDPERFNVWIGNLLPLAPTAADEITLALKHAGLV